MSKKLLVAGVVLTLVAAVFAVVPASAQTVNCANIGAMLTALGVTDAAKIAQAQVAFGCGAAASTASYTFTRNLTVGSTGADVTALQTKLGVTPATGYFGAITKAAVIAYQTANGVPGTGYVGPLTLAKLNYVAPVVVPVTPVSTVGGTDGTISDVKTISSYNNEEIGEGQNNVKVLGFEVKASKEGDIAVRSVNVTFDGSANSGSTRLDKYVDSVKVMLGSKELGSADASDFTKDSAGVYTKTITLDKPVVKSDTTEKFYIAIDAVSTLDSGDITGDAWTIDVNNIRYEDGSGVVSTEALTGDLPILNIPVSFVTFSTSADTNLKISLDSASPDAGIVIADDNSTTDGVVLLKGKIQVKGTSDVTLNELPVTLSVGGATDVDNVTNSVTLTIDGEDFSETVNTATLTSATVTFDNLDLTLDAGKTYSFTIAADVNELDNVNFTEGDTLTASLSTDNRSAIDADNQEGDALADSEKSGSATGEAQEFRTQGISVALISATSDVTTGSSNYDDTATFTLKFKVTAIGEDAYLATTVANGYTYTVDAAGTATTGGVSAVVTNNTDTTMSTNHNWLIEAGSSGETITLTVARTPYASTAALFRAALTGIKWSATDDHGALGNTYSSNLDSFTTPYVSVN